MLCHTGPVIVSVFASIGDVCEAVRHARTIQRQIRTAQALDHTELYSYAKDLRVPFDLLQKTAQLGRLPVVNFAAGGLGMYTVGYLTVPDTNCALRGM